MYQGVLTSHPLCCVSRPVVGASKNDHILFAEMSFVRVANLVVSWVSRSSTAAVSSVGASLFCISHKRGGDMRELEWTDLVFYPRRAG